MPTYKEAWEKMEASPLFPLDTPELGKRYNPKQDKYQTLEEFTTAAKAWNVKQGKGKQAKEKPKVGEEFNKAQKKFEDQQAIYEDLQKEHVRLSQQLKVRGVGTTAAQAAQATKAVGASGSDDKDDKPAASSGVYKGVEGEIEKWKDKGYKLIQPKNNPMDISIFPDDPRIEGIYDQSYKGKDLDTGFSALGYGSRTGGRSIRNKTTYTKGPDIGASVSKPGAPSKPMYSEIISREMVEKPQETKFQEPQAKTEPTRKEKRYLKKREKADIKFAGKNPTDLVQLLGYSKL